MITFETRRAGLLARRLGFGRNASGGLVPFTVISDADSGLGTLRDALSSGERWITFAPGLEIKLDTPIKVKPNTTIDGRGAPPLITGAGLNLGRTHNVILTNLEIRGVKVDAVGVFNSKDVWIDQCTLGEASDGALDVVDGSERVSITGCHLFNQNKTMLIGNNNSKTGDRKQKVTVHACFFDHTKRRNPLLRYGYAHISNSVFLNWGDGPNGGDCVNSTYGGRIFLQNNFFGRGGRAEAARNYVPKHVPEPGYILAEGNVTSGVELRSFHGTQVESPGYDTSYVQPMTITLRDRVVARAGVMEGSFFDLELARTQGVGTLPDSTGGPNPVPTPDPVPEPDPIPAPDPAPPIEPAPNPGVYIVQGETRGQMVFRPDRDGMFVDITLRGFDPGKVADHAIVKGRKHVVLNLKKIGGPRLVFKGPGAQLWHTYVNYATD